jgi:fructose-specific PTS system IIA-like component
MPLELAFACPLPNGMHARPASALEAAARGFAAEVQLINQRTGSVADARSVMSLVAADIRPNDPCVLRVNGADERQAFARMKAFVEETLPHCDPPLPQQEPQEWLPLPRLLRNSGARMLQGTSVVRGIGRGRVVRAGGFRLPDGLALSGGVAAEERRRLASGLELLQSDYERRLAALGQGVERELVAAHQSLARDGWFCGLMTEAIAARGKTAAGAIAEAEAHFSSMLLARENPLLRERVLDIQDVCRELLARIYPGAKAERELPLPEAAVVVAETLTPGQFLALDRSRLKGLVLAEAGRTSHTVVLARSFGVPMLVGVAGIAGISESEPVTVDAELGAVVWGMTPGALRYYELQARRERRRSEVLQRHAAVPARTSDGGRLEVGANLVSSEEAGLAFASGADGVGLFRTEMLFLGRSAAPGEEEQFDAYRRVLESAGGKPVIIRLLDIGGDKPLPYLQLPKEENPFLGYRGIRIYRGFEPVIRTQLRTLLRASAHGRLRLLLPMVSCLEEARWVRGVMDAEWTAMNGRGGSCPIALGAMIEVPSAAFQLDELSRELDFFSIGSNDLLQYFMAADRADARLAGLYSPLQPAFLRLLKQIVDRLRQLGKWVGLCGEMGGQARHLPLLIGLGLDEISVAPSLIGELKRELSRLSAARCRECLENALRCGSAAEVERLLAAKDLRQAPPLVAPELVEVDCDAANKEEAIQIAVDLLHAQGRAVEPRLVEEAVWAREQVYSTGFGAGFAVPHCKSDAVAEGSLVVLRLKRGVDWGALDGQPVRVVVLLAMRESEGASGHMKVFASLARQVMHEEFRARIERGGDAADIAAFLGERLPPGT